MNKPVELKIGHLPWRYAAGRIDIPGLQLIEGSPWELRAGARHWKLVHVRPEEGPPDPSDFAKYANLKRKIGYMPIVLAPYLRADVRRALEAHGVPYFDFHGNVHLEAPGLLVHVQTPVRQEASRALGLVGVRGAQTVLEQPERAWGVSDLARDARMSVGQAQNVMKILETETLVFTEGKGPARRRRVTDRGRFLDWINLQKPGRESRAKLTCALYARTPEDLWKKIGKRLGAVEYAITGSAAASILGAGPTSLQRSVVRVAGSGPLRDIADLLDAEISDRGANLVLWNDTGLLGTIGSLRVRGMAIAPKVRVFMDLHTELRGADLASEFRARVLGY